MAKKKFQSLVGDLVVAELAAKAASGDATEARNIRNTAAIDAIKAAYAEGLEGEDVRATLLEAGVLKGTVSKIVTIIGGLRSKAILPEDLKSLSGAYNAVKMVEKIAAAPAVEPATPYAGTPPAVVATNPADAMQIIVDAIASITDPSERFKVGGQWIEKFTNTVTELLKEEDEEE